MSRPLILLALLLAFGCSGPGVEAPLTVSRLFSDGAVLQRNTTVPVWGTATAGETVTVALDDAVQEVRAGRDGTWRAEIQAHEAGGPHRLAVSTTDEELEFGDIWFGDVWIASGQSNMEWPVIVSQNAEQEIREANDPMIRHLKVPHSWAYTPQSTLAGGEWHPADSAHVGAFTAVGYFFAQSLRESMDIPVGILNTSWGGSRVEAWMNPDMLEVHPDSVAARLEADSLAYEELLQTYTVEHGASDSEDPGFADSIAVWADPALDLAQWSDIAVPGSWESAGYEGLDGIGWYRTTIELSGDQLPGATLHLGQLDDRDMTWVNGVLVGQTQGVQNLRVYELPEGVLQAGTNTIAVRIQDFGGNGGMLGMEDDLRIESGGGTTLLGETWKFRIGMFSVNRNAGKNHVPTVLYNKMIHPILSFPATGFIWYQGESNAGNAEDAAAYASLFQSMISGWRDLWNHDDAPFLFVSLANFRAAEPEPGDSHWAILRESQASALSLDNVGQAITIDIGDALDIHPRNKQDVGSRLALAARHIAYGEELVYSGPVYRAHRIDGNEVTLYFDHVGSGLTTRGGEPGGFAVAGADGPFVWADARLEGNSVVVSSEAIADPVAVRYAWADNPDRANLYNSEGLPAAPFRTDR